MSHEPETEIMVAYLRDTLHLDVEAIEEFRQCASDVPVLTLTAINDALARRHRMMQLRMVGGDLTMLPPGR